jgi:hypothetical protein
LTTGIALEPEQFKEKKMAKISDYPDRFSFDVASDLERIDGAFTRLLGDRNQWQEFLKDPNGVLVKLGLHPPATPEANERANLIFYATLANKRLVQLALEHRFSNGLLSKNT